MSNIEKIKAEIERLREDYLNRSYTFVPVTMERLLEFINSLPGEKPSEDLEEAAEELFETIEIQEHENIFEDTFKKIFIAGAEWMRKKDVEDMYMSDNRHFLKCYEQGKVDMRVEMMKDAVEGFIFQSEDYYPKELVAQYNGELKHGDKVKIIIIKDND